MFEDFNNLPSSEEETDFLPFISIDEDTEESSIDITQNSIPLLPLRGNTLFPGVTIPLSVARDRSLQALREAQNNQDKLIAVVAQKDPAIDEPTQNDLYTVGVIAKIIRVLHMPDDTTTVVIQGKKRFILDELDQETPFLSAKGTIIDDPELPQDLEFTALISTLKDIAIQIIELSQEIPAEIASAIRNIDRSDFLVGFVATNMSAKLANKQTLLECNDWVERCYLLLGYLNEDLQLLELKGQIKNRIQVEIDKQQRDYFLQQQLKAIHEELDDEAPENILETLQQRTKKMAWSKETANLFEREFNKLRRLNPAMPDYSLSLNYLELLLDLPWNTYTTDKLDLTHAMSVLNKDHYGLEKIKNRIIEYLAVLKLKGDMKSPILCFVGPPGVGKTSLGRSIATALKRQYVRISLGGLHDESEIRGHRRTYIGAMPGRIIQSLRKAHAANPVLVLDEIDKVTSNFKGDPASALLEVLDPEQNSTFYDNYLEIEFDLSKVLFIATANSIADMHPALRDRMEIIQLSGYSQEEKLEIAKRYLVPKQRTEHGIKASQAKLSDKVLQKVISEYTFESGVRDFERKIAALMRALAKSIVQEEKHTPSLTSKDVERILGNPPYDRELYTDTNPAGVAIGLAWTPMGGDILFIETSISKGKGSLQLTGSLGEVMKESATTALSYIRANAEKLGIRPETLDEINIHLHIPEGAVPKDGPSAGITMLTALSSALSLKKVKPYLAMSGEITLRGKVLPVGGIKEKILAAKRAGMQHIILPKNNRKDVEEINPEYIQGITFYYVSEMIEVLQIALQ